MCFVSEHSVKFLRYIKRWRFIGRNIPVTQTENVEMKLQLHGEYKLFVFPKDLLTIWQNITHLKCKTVRNAL